MDKFDRYRAIICQFLEDFLELDPLALLVFDREHDRYMVVHNEWRGDSRIYGCAIHLDLIEGQVWIQHNSTEIYVDRELLRRGIAATDILLGFRSPTVRQRIAAAFVEANS